MSEDGNVVVTLTQFDCPDCSWPWVMTYPRGTDKAAVARRQADVMAAHRASGDCERHQAGETTRQIEGREQ